MLSRPPPRERVPRGSWRHSRRLLSRLPFPYRAGGLRVMQLFVSRVLYAPRYGALSKGASCCFSGAAGVLACIAGAPPRCLRGIARARAGVRALVSTRHGFGNESPVVSRTGVIFLSAPPFAGQAFGACRARLLPVRFPRSVLYRLRYQRRAVLIGALPCPTRERGTSCQPAGLRFFFFFFLTTTPSCLFSLPPPGRAVPALGCFSRATGTECRSRTCSPSHAASVGALPRPARVRRSVFLFR
jgi:hypothetical protein